MKNIMPQNTNTAESRRKWIKSMSILFAGSVFSTLGHAELSLENRYIFRNQGTSLSDLHTIVYRELIRNMEQLLTSQNIRIIGFQGEIRRNSNGIFELVYTVTTRPLRSGENPHRHIELISHVWREKGVAKTKIKARYTQTFSTKIQEWQKKYTGTSSTSVHESGDDDLYQIGTLVLAEGKAR